MNRTQPRLFSKAKDIASFLLTQGWDEVINEEGDTEKLSEIQWGDYSFFVDGDEVYRTQGDGHAELIWTRK